MALPLFEFAYCPKFNEKLEYLSKLAMPEAWNFKNSPSDPERPLPILYNYIHHTFIRLEEEEKIAINGDYACFNTSLVTPNQEEIYALFTKNKFPHLGPIWYFLSFYKESQTDMLRFKSLPCAANYFTDPAELIYDARIPLRRDLDHIIDDNAERFPAPYSNIHDPSIKHQLQNLFNGAIDNAIKRVRRNYKTAIPQYYRKEIQLLFPICLLSPNKPDLALAVHREEQNGLIYVARTCLTLDMAYNNARLIARPDNEWLSV